MKRRQMYYKKFLSAVMASAVVISSVPGTVIAAADDAVDAQAENLLAEFSFDDKENGLQGGQAVADAKGDCAIQEIDGRKALYLDGSGDYLEVKKADGSSLLTDQTTLSVSFDVKQGNGTTNWAFYAAPNANTQTYPNEHYLGMLLNGKNITVERYNNNGSRPGSASTSIVKNWTHVDAIFDAGNTTIYVNGVKKAEQSSVYSLPAILGDSSILYIGKANWVNGEYFTGWLDNYKIYGGVLTEEEIQANAAETVNTILASDKEALSLPESVTADFKLPAVGDYGSEITWTMEENDAIVLTDGTAKVTRGTEDQTVKFTAAISCGASTATKEFLVTVLGITPENTLKEAAASIDIPNKEDVRGNITLPKKAANGVEITWTTDHPEIVNVNEIPAEVEGYDPTPAGTVTRPQKDTVVTMTAHMAAEDKTLTKEIQITVKAAPKEIKEEDYTDYFFAYFAGEGYSDGEQVYFASSRDGLNWDDLNENKPVLYSSLGEKGVRDPFILRSAEGDKFYMIATDLKINGGNGWSAAQTAGSQSLLVWESTDLVHWSDARMVPVSAPIEAGCTWAPEAMYDELTGEYVVYWASKVKGDNYGKQRLYYAKTRDFYTFTEPKVFIDYNQSSIDTSILHENGTYYRFTKNEGGSTNQLGAKTKTIFLEKSDTLLGEYTQIVSDTLNANQWVEGPSIYKLNEDDNADAKYCLLVDNYGAGGYYPLVTNDLDSGVFTRPSSYKMPSRARHGTPIRVTAEEYETIMIAYGGWEPTPTPTPEPTKTPVRDIFDDVNEGDWFEESVQCVYDQGIMTGMDETHFVPAGLLERAQFATILYRMDEKPDAEYKEIFTDVADGEYYSDAVMWAGSEAVGVVTGYARDGEEVRFGPADMITREQMVTMLYRYARYKGYDITKASSMAEFPDSDDVSAFAKDAMSWAVAEGLIKGDNGKLNPQGNVSRAQCAMVIQRFMETVVKEV